DGREFHVPKALDIDPSFLVALPEEFRQEILTDQIRNFEREENLRRAAAANPTVNLNSQLNDATNNDNFAARANQATSEAVIGEILGKNNLGFISALPAEFIRTLQPHLRQQVLADMDQSQIGALPEHMANEARTLRANMETQQQQYLCERMYRPIRTDNSRALQKARGNRTDRQPPSWYTLRTGTNAGDLNSNISTIRSRDRQLLDYESICCLLVLLFIDDKRLIFSRLQKVLKN
ncbi:unnamed protein product, partial [Rotaria sp. Silwood2]